MKDNALTYFTVVVLGIWSVSCERELNIKVPYGGDEFVVYGELPLGEPVSLHITKTSAVNGVLNFNVPLKDFTVILYENDKVKDTLKLIDNAYFESDKSKKTQLDKSYYINVFDKTKTLIAQTQVQKPTKAIEEFSIKVKPENIKGLNGGVVAKEFVVKVKDTDQVDDYYSFDVISYVSENKGGITTFAIGKNPEIKSDCGYYFGKGYTFTSKCFINGTISISHGVELRSYDTKIEKSRTPDSVVVVLKKIDKYFYDYFATIDDASLFENAFVSPLPLNSNMRKGLGVWSPVNTQKFTYIPDK